MRIISAVLLVAALALAVGACGEGRNAVTGTIRFDGDSAIPDLGRDLEHAGAVLTVALRDVSYQDAPSELIASQTIEDPERFPIDFAVPYKPDEIDPRAEV